MNAINDLNQTCLAILICGKPFTAVIIKHSRPLKARAWAQAALASRILELDFT